MAGADYAGPVREDGATDSAVRQVREDLSRGEFLRAYDGARAAVEAGASDLVPHYLAVLSLARAGATDRAGRVFDEYGLAAAAARVGPALAEDLTALGARLAKDRALDGEAAQRPERAALAAQLYETVALRFGQPYGSINAATMWLIAGDEVSARRLAGEALALVAVAATGTSQERYWMAATEAEALLILGRPAEAREALQRTVGEAPGDYAARATTRRQLALVCGLRGFDTAVLSPLATPGVVHYCGHMTAADGSASRLSTAGVAALEHEVSDVLGMLDAGFAYGSLACGADIVIAEALLARGGELNVVLPFEVEEFKALSVVPGGAGWEDRFDRCLARASNVVVATEGGHLGDDALFDYAARVAMGLARIRARFLTAEAVQVAVWDGVAGPGDVGTHADIATWAVGGGRTQVIRVEGVGATLSHTALRPANHGSGRKTRAMIFGDIKGFGRLTDGETPRFVQLVLGPLAEVLDQFRESGTPIHSSGDGFFAVFSSASAAADCALSLQECFSGIDLAEARLPPHLGLRIGGHIGPVFELEDPFRREPSFYGLQVTRAARIEPKTPEGEVYVTAPFAALVALESRGGISCQYVGHMPTAKEHGVLPMYLLKRRA